MHVESQTPKLLLERLHLGELTKAEAEALRNRLTDADLVYLEGLAASDAELLRLHPPALVGEEVRRRLSAREAQTRRSPWLRLVVPTLAMAAAAAGILVAVTADMSTVVEAQPEILLKGDSRILVYTPGPGGQGAELVSEEQRLSAGQDIQLGFVTDDTFAVLVSIDGRGAVTLHTPSGPDTTAQPGRTVLDHAITLDDAPEFERFFLITSKVRLDVAQVENAARALARSGAAREGELTLPPGAELVTFLLQKGP